MISEETIERVREAADIVQIIGEHVQLRRTGSDYRGPCPFHQGTHRNFAVVPKKGIYHCFVCHEQGDVFDFLQKRLGMDWPSALRYVAERAGIEVQETRSNRAEPDEREPFWEINSSAADYFRRQLWDDDAGRAARDYLTMRRVSREVADRFGLGFAPRDANALRAHLNALGFQDERLLEAGLLVRKEETGELRPRFRNRLIFPILDVAGHHVGFGGRLLGPGEPKYLNSADSKIFSKGRLLYGLNWAKANIRREDRVLIVEGYFDVVRLISAGLETTVAPLGTALTEAQAALLRKYTKHVYLLYDSDTAGLKATFRAGDELLRHGFAVQVVTLPDGEDPDSFVDKHGGAALTAQLGGALDVFERKVQLLERGGWFADLRKKRRAVDRMLPTIRATADPLTRDMYIARASEAAGVSKALLEREASAGDSRPHDDESARPGIGSTPAPTAPAWRGHGTHDSAGTREQRRRTERGAAAERELVRVMLHHRSQVETIAERVGANDFSTIEYRDIFRALLAAGASASLEDIAAALSSDAATTMQALLDEPGAIVDVERTVEGSVAALQVRAMEQELADIDRMLPLASDAAKDDLIRRKAQIRRDIQGLGGVGFRHYGKSRST
ncbi:MAG TPA: DNA primase [Gemmatimonadaceae bacterium]|nr:DNA primase [Gemmatimonadaceae bacterium]